MKFKLLGTVILSSALVLTACGQSEDHSKKDDDKKSESKSDKKSNDPKKNKKSDDNKKKDNNKDKQQSSKDNQQNEQSNEQNNEQQTQQNNTQNNSNPNNQQTQQPQQQTAQNQQANSKKPTKEEIAEWDRQNIKGGTDYGLIDPKEANETSQSQNEEPDEWVKGQEEWANASQSEKEEIRKQDAKKYGYEYDPKNYEE
ncbi:hypothetical protein [Staphylococcus pasteuri]|uniref:hypothetical protein n=1 Tax=Staphylococcus pasteuri TaxID=45972 RepID=UPI000E363E56|nr:hypothetical protein [Staphylococcus pasteuri]RFD69437.1 hypothetical protein A7974_02930 [Staphylococcus pasteuri]